MADIEISVVIPIFKNEECLNELHSRITKNLDGLNSELIYVNDASPDQSKALIDQLIKTSSNTKLLDLPQNVGQQKATLAGLKHASGQYIVVLDADLQDHPELIPVLYEKQKGKTGSTFIYRIGTYQQISRMITSTLIKLLVQFISGLHRKAGSFYITDNQTAQRVIVSADACKYPYLTILVAHHSHYIQYHRAPRPKSNFPSGYSLKGRINSAYKAIYCALFCVLSKRASI